MHENKSCIKSSIKTKKHFTGNPQPSKLPESINTTPQSYASQVVLMDMGRIDGRVAKFACPRVINDQKLSFYSHPVLFQKT